MDSRNVAALLNDDSSLKLLHVLSFGLLHEGDEYPRPFTFTGGIVGATDTTVTLENGIRLPVEEEDVVVLCGSGTRLEDLPNYDAAGFVVILERTTGFVTEIECVQEF